MHSVLKFALTSGRIILCTRYYSHVDCNSQCGEGDENMGPDRFAQIYWISELLTMLVKWSSDVKIAFSLLSMFSKL